ncbi:hypothetical protein [Undibacterium sp. TS12]|nr:hypothetical protein [Undibacterium sp. TS12]MCH8620484.1 hypothetical protein [Undibacterium sp. TS12]
MDGARYGKQGCCHSTDAVALIAFVVDVMKNCNMLNLGGKGADTKAATDG